MAVQLTPSAVERVRKFAAGQTPPALRFGIRKSGCSGFAYEVSALDAVHDGDHIHDQDGVRVVIDATSLPVIDGTVIDFVREGLNSNFVFRNPNSTAECGCGESFSVNKTATFG
jgi:iron-sulfur cluster assembly protein